MIEKVNPCHPDKVADRIAGALVDYAYSVQSCPRIAVEVLIGHRICHIIAETSVHIPVTLVQDIITRIAGDGVVMDIARWTDATGCQSGGGLPLRRQRYLQGHAADRRAETALGHRPTHLWEVSL